MRLIEKFWTSDSVAARVGRAALAPLEGAYRTAAAARSELFDRGVLPVRRGAIPVVSIGNLTVGGTGKTPVSAYVASRLGSLGRKPAIIIRGYGDDEPLVHARLNPGVPVIVEPDRARGIARAASGGADVAVLDDGFQHRQAHRDLDIVLVSAEGASRSLHLLPAGPFREAPSAMRRASVAIVTRKVASDEDVEETRKWIEKFAPRLPVLSVRLSPGELLGAVPSGMSRPFSDVSGRRVLAIAAIGNSRAFFQQLERAGASVVPLGFPDHHAFTARDVRRALRLARGVEMVLCTLKDAVKLAPIWPPGELPLLYVSLSVELESGGAVLDRMLESLPPNGHSSALAV